MEINFELKFSCLSQNGRFGLGKEREKICYYF